GHYLFFSRATRAKVLALLGVFVFLLAAYKRGIHLHDAVRPAEQFGLSLAQGFADTVTHEPRGFLAEAEHPTDLKGAHALLARHHQVRSGKPLVERNLAALVQGPYSHRERLTASVAVVEARTVALALHER